MSTINIQVIGLDELIADAQEAGANAEPLVNAAIANSATQIQRNVRDRAPHRTGALQRSILTTTDGLSALVSVNESYGSYIEYGTRPHDIVPVNKKVLYWNGAANPVIRVHHPGTRANPFFSSGVSDSETYISEQFLKVLERLMDVIAGHPR